MEYKVKEKTQSKLVAEIVNSKEEIENAKKESYKKLIEKVKVPGFRVGKAPYEIGAAFIGEGRLLEESLDLLLDKSLLELFDKENIEPFTRPYVDVKEVSNEKFVYEVEIEFLPEVNVDLSNKIVIKRNVEVKEEEIEEKLKELQDTFTELTPKDSPVENGDIVELTYSINGKEEQSITVEVGKDKVFADFNDKVIGKNVNEEFEVSNENTTIKFKIVSIKTKKIPEINDDFAKEIGVNNVGELKEKIRKEIYENKKLQIEENRGQEALLELVSNLNVELPSRYIEESVEERFKEYETEYLKRGLKLENLLEKEGKTIDDFKKELREDVIQELKETLIIRSIVRNYNLQATEEEINEEFEHLLLEENIDRSKVRLTDELRNYFKNAILRNKALSILKENAIIEFGGE